VFFESEGGISAVQTALSSSLQAVDLGSSSAVASSKSSLSSAFKVVVSTFIVAICSFARNSAYRLSVSAFGFVFKPTTANSSVQSGKILAYKSFEK